MHDVDGQDLGETIEADSWSAAEKFAELIVGECARIGELKEQGYGAYDPDVSVGWYMKKYFGVE